MHTNIIDESTSITSLQFVRLGNVMTNALVYTAH